MSNDNRTTTSNSSTISLNSNINTMNTALKNKVKKIANFFKPNIFNIILTFIVFLITLFLLQNLGLSLIIVVFSYFIFSLMLQFAQKEKLAEKLHLQIIKNNSIPNFIETTSDKVILLSYNKKLIAMALMKIEWSSNYLSILSLSNFFLEEGIQIQDCREGCYLIVRKVIEIKSAPDVKEKAVKLIKELEKTILLTRKKLEIEHEFLQLSLIKGKENILTILNLGSPQEKFVVHEELSEEDFDVLRKTSQLIVSE